MAKEEHGPEYIDPDKAMEIDLLAVQDLHEKGGAPDAYSALYEATAKSERSRRAVARIETVADYAGYIALEAPKRAMEIAEQNESRWFLTEQQIAEHFPPEKVERLLPRFKPPQSMGQSATEHFATKEEAERYILEIHTARNFYNLFRYQVGTSPDIRTFTWRMQAATNPAFHEHADNALKGARVFRRLEASLYTQTKQFMEAHPDQAQAAFDLWQRHIVALLGDDPVDHPSLKRIMRHDVADDDISLHIGDENYILTEPRLRDLFHRPAEMPKDTKEMLNQVARGALERNSELIQALEELLLNDDPDNSALPVRRGALMQKSIDLIERLLEAMAPQVPLARDFTNLIKRAGGATFTTYIRLANTNLVLGTLKQSEKGHDLQQLDATSVKDLPRAIDRISLMLMAQMPEDKLTDERAELFSSARHLARLMAQKGSSEKLEEHVLTVADMIARYPDVSSEQLDLLIAEEQKAKSENMSDSQERVQRLYRSLRHRGSKVWFSKNTVGRGLLK